MKVTLLVVGSVRGALASPVAEYEERAARYWRLEVREVAAGAGRKASDGEVRKAEDERLLPHLPSSGQVVALTREGKGLSSRKLARFLEARALRSVPEIAFVIGGAHGLGEKVLKRAGVRLSLSPMTLPHEVARLVLVEQLYRAGTILRNEPYHKGP
jgi:23S rRNA (pseudouridine1915-N3)-methyltransferase